MKSIFLFLFLFFAKIVVGQTPKLLPFQGRLTDQNGEAVANGVYLIQFKIFDQPVGGEVKWTG